MSMTLTELRYLTALAREKHFGRAAQQCHVTQPTLSVGIRKLEDTLGVLLVERAGREVRLTAPGERLAVQAARVLEEVDKLRQLANQSADPLAEPLRLGAIYTIAPYLFPSLVPAIRRLAPQLPLLLEEGFTAQLSEKLLSGALDVIVIALPFELPGVLTLPLYDEPFAVAMPASHAWATREEINAEDLLDEELLLLGSGHCFRDQVLNFCSHIRQNERGAMQRMMEGSSLETIRQMVAAGVGMTVLPMSAVTSQPDNPLVHIAPIAGTPPVRRVALAWRNSFTRPPAIDMLKRAIQQSGLGGVDMLA